MIIYHEKLKKEAECMAEAVAQVYGMTVDIEEADLGKFYREVELKDGKGREIRDFGFLEEKGPRKVDGKAIDEFRILLLKDDIYVPGASKCLEDWAFGYSYPDFETAVLSVARLRGKDSVPADKVEVPMKRYLDRVAHLAVHEIGHGHIDRKHMKMAVWCKTDPKGKVIQEMKLGEHCTDPHCAMYEVIDLVPKPHEFMLLGKRKKFDAYLDPLLDAGRYPEWLCKQCDAAAMKGDDRKPQKQYLKISERVKKILSEPEKVIDLTE